MSYTVILIGRLGHDPVKKSENSASFPILNTIIEGGEQKVQSHDIMVFGKQKDVCMKYLAKGDLCCIEGKPDSQSSNVIATKITFLSNRREKNA